MLEADGEEQTMFLRCGQQHAARYPEKPQNHAS